MSDFKARLLKLAENLQKATEGESPRAKIILFATQIDEALRELLVKFLKPPRRANEDDLLGRFRALSSFSARIALAYRVGLISKDDAEAFDILRGIRNDCAHKIVEFSLGKPPYSNHLKRFASLTTQDPCRAYAMKAYPDPRDRRGLLHPLLSRPYHVASSGYGVRCAMFGRFHDGFTSHQTKIG